MKCLNDSISQNPPERRTWTIVPFSTLFDSRGRRRGFRRRRRPFLSFLWQIAEEGQLEVIVHRDVGSQQLQIHRLGFLREDEQEVKAERKAGVKVLHCSAGIWVHVSWALVPLWPPVLSPDCLLSRQQRTSPPRSCPSPPRPHRSSEEGKIKINCQIRQKKKELYFQSF